MSFASLSSRTLSLGQDCPRRPGGQRDADPLPRVLEEDPLGAAVVAQSSFVVVVVVVVAAFSQSSSDGGLVPAREQHVVPGGEYVEGQIFTTGHRQPHDDVPEEGPVRSGGEPEQGAPLGDEAGPGPVSQSRVRRGLFLPLLGVERRAKGGAVGGEVEPVGVLAGAAGARLARRGSRREKRAVPEIKGRRGDFEGNEGGRVSAPSSSGARREEEARAAAAAGDSGDGARDLEREVPLRPVVEGPGPPGGLRGVGGGARVRRLEEVGDGAVILGGRGG